MTSKEIASHINQRLIWWEVDYKAVAQYLGALSKIGYVKSKKIYEGKIKFYKYGRIPIYEIQRNEWSITPKGIAYIETLLSSR